jgi:hypothetical protein
MRGEYIDLEPPRAQVAAGRLALTDQMELVEVENDVFGVVENLKRIDAGLCLYFNQKEEVFVLFWKGLNEHGHFVEDWIGAYQHLDSRIVHLIERLAARENSSHYDLNAELDKLEKAKDVESERAFMEHVGPIAEELAFALKKDLGIKNRAYMHSPKKKRRRR